MLYNVARCLNSLSLFLVSLLPFVFDRVIQVLTMVSDKLFSIKEKALFRLNNG